MAAPWGKAWGKRDVTMAVMITLAFWYFTLPRSQPPLPEVPPP